MSGHASPLSLLVVGLVAGVTVAAITHVSTAVANPSGVTRDSPSIDLQTQETAPNATAQLSGKWALYEVIEKGPVGANASAVVVAACKDADDVPVSGACYSHAGGRLRATQNKEWTSVKKAAQHQCTIFNPTSRTLDAHGSIVCRRVTTPND